MLADKLNMSPDEAERWIVNLIRNARLDAKIDSKLVIIHIASPIFCQSSHHPHLAFCYLVPNATNLNSKNSKNLDRESYVRFYIHIPFWISIKLLFWIVKDRSHIFLVWMTFFWHFSLMQNSKTSEPERVIFIPQVQFAIMYTIFMNDFSTYYKRIFNFVGSSCDGHTSCLALPTSNREDEESCFQIANVGHEHRKEIVQ